MTLDEMQKLCDEATPGPWVVALHSVDIFRLEDGEHCTTPIGNCETVSMDQAENSEANAALIAAARTYLPRLIALARAVKVERDWATKSEDPPNWMNAANWCDEHDKRLKAVDEALAALEAPP